ncbi:MobA/MobL family protein [Providencia manganoxydans]|uniref:MobA/MobL family protein n=1 Tax=Providencia manganoxydans TaxID=2923283 RepID=UPI003F6E931D
MFSVLGDKFHYRTNKNSPQTFCDVLEGITPCSKNPERGGAKKVRFGETPTERKAFLITQRLRWATLQNNHLERYQHPDRVDARSLKEQGLEREPERHFGAGQVRQFDHEQLHVFCTTVWALVLKVN